MSERDFFGFCFYFFIFAGMWFLKLKEKIGWVFRFVGEAGWVGIGLWIGMYSIWIPGLAFMVMDYCGYVKWDEEEKAILETEKRLKEEMDAWLLAGVLANEKVEEKLEDKQRKSKRKKLAKGRLVSGKKKVQPARRRRSVKANGKRRSRSNDVRKSTKRSRS